MPSRFSTAARACWAGAILACTPVVHAQDSNPEPAAATSTWSDPATTPAEDLGNLKVLQRSLLLDVAESSDRAIVVGDRGHILVSETRSEWRQVPTPTRSMLTAVTAVGNDVWAVGHDQVIIHSKDGGSTWTLQHHDVAAEGPLLDVLFLDAQRGYAVGAYGQFLATTDAGATWNVQWISDRTAASAEPVQEAVPEEDVEDSGLASTDMGEDEGDPHLNAIVRTPQGLLIVGEAGSGYRSTDEGASWTAFEFPYEGSLFGAVAIDDGSVVAFGLRGNALVSSDLGLSWAALDTGTEATLQGGAAVPGGRAVFVGASGAVLLKPAGETTLRLYNFAAGGVMSAVLPLTETQFLTVGENGIQTYEPSAN